MDARLEVRLVEALERQATALEAIQAELVEAREHPRFMPTGMVVVKEGSAEHRQAQLAAGVPGSGIRRPG